MKTVSIWLIKLRITLYHFFLQYIGYVWLYARFYAAWIEYQQDDHYRIRITIFGFRYAFNMFLDSQFEQQYLLERRFQKEPLLRLRYYFIPWTIEMPAVLETATCEGFFKNEAKPKVFS